MWLIWVLIVRFCVGCRKRLMFGILFIVVCRWVMIFCIWLLCLFNGLRLICKCVLFSDGLVLLMLINEVRFCIVGFCKITFVIWCCCWVILVKELDCGVCKVFWIMLLFCIGKKFFGMNIYSSMLSSSVLSVMFKVSYGWFSIFVSLWL